MLRQRALDGRAEGRPAQVGSVGGPPLEPSDRSVGVITEADMARAVAGGMDVNETRIHDLLTAHPAAILPARSIGDAARTVVNGESRQLPAADGTGPVGTVGIAGVCGALPGPPAA
jgi:CBS domain-containing protein